MANFIDLIYSKEAIQGAKEIHAELSKTHELIIKMSKTQLDFNGGTSPKNPAQMQKVIADFQKIEQSSNKATAALVKNAERQRLAEIKLQQDREKAFAKYDAQLQKEQAKLNAAQNLYNKTQQQLNNVQAAYNNLSTRKERYNNLTAQEEQRLITLQKVSERYNSTLKAVDATVGKHTRNVGNYAGSFNPLSNSINQLTREMPAFTYSIQTGFMALSNNIPIFTDAISNAIQQNKMLQAEGKPTQSVLKQVAGALFSFQTLLGVGITLLTVYGKEIGEWVSELVGADSVLTELNERQKEFNNSRHTGRKDAQSDIVELKKYLAVYNNLSLSDEDRMIAFDKIAKQYPYYIKNIKDATTANGEYSAGVKKLLIDLEKQKQLETETKLQVTNKQTLIDLEKELASLKKLEAQKEKDLKNMVKSGASAQALATVSNELRTVQEKRIKTEGQVNEYQEKINANQIEIIRLTGERIGLDYVEEKQRKKKIKDLKELNIVEEDYIASQYKLNRLQLELERDSANKIYENESRLFDERADAFSVLVAKKAAIADLDYKEQVRLENKRVSDAKKAALEEYNDAVSQEGATSNFKIRAKKKYDAYIYSLELQSKFNLEELELQYSNNILTAQEDLFLKLRLLRERELQQREETSINKAELEGLQEYNKRLLNISKNTTLKTIEEIEDDKENVILTAQKKRLQLELQQIADKLVLEFSYEKENTEAINKLNKEAFEKQKQLNDLEIKEGERKAAAQKKYLSEIKAYMDGFVNDFASQSGMPTLFKALNNEITGFGENAAVTMLAVTEIFQEAFNLMNSQSEAYFNAQFDRLERQKNIAIQFAGESSTAREEIERQYEERRKEIERRRAEQQKRQAMFNIAINTAQAVVGALATVPPNIPLSIAVGLIGAAQLAMVASQQIPAYAEGTLNHPGGAMLINDGKGSNYTETVVTPDGKVKQYKGRNVVVDAPKGTMVFNDKMQAQLNSILVDAGIGFGSKMNMPEINMQNGITLKDLDYVMSKYANKESYHFSIDERGIQKTIARGAQKTNLINSRIRIRKGHV